MDACFQKRELPCFCVGRTASTTTSRRPTRRPTQLGIPSGGCHCVDWGASSLLGRHRCLVRLANQQANELAGAGVLGGSAGTAKRRKRPTNRDRVPSRGTCSDWPCASHLCRTSN